MIGRYRGSCWTLEQAGVSIGRCCDSCHEDVNLGYDMSQIDLPNGDWLHVCCRVASRLEEAASLAELLAALNNRERADD